MDGLGLYLLFDFLADRGPLRQRLRSYLSIANLCGVALFVVLGLYYATKVVDISPPLG